MKRMIILAAALLIGAAASAQRLSVATNLLDYADFGTLNVEGDVAVARQWTLTAGAKYNPFLFKADTPEPLSARQQLYAAGVRFWPWHVFSGWWIGGKVHGPGTCSRAGGSGERSNTRNTTGEGSARPLRTRGIDMGRASPPVSPTCSIPT